MELNVESDSTPAVLLSASKFIARYAASVLPMPFNTDKTTVFVSPDTSHWRKAGDAVFFADSNTIFPLKGTTSAWESRPKDTQFTVGHEIALPLNHHMTSLLAAIALHVALISEAEEISTAAVPKIALKSSACFTEKVTVRGYNTARVSFAEGDAIADVPLTDEVSAFASAHALRSYLADTIPLIRRIFSNVSALQLRYEHDSETEQDWLSIEVKMAGEADQILEQYDSYIRQFNRLVPWPARSFIRLNYGIT